jgi:hypothetical protein
MFTHISTQTSMNPTGDKLTAELQQTTHIEQPAVVGVGSASVHSTTGETLGAATHVVASGLEFTGQKLGAGLETVASGVGYTGEKLKSAGEKIGETIASVVAPAVAVTGDKIESTIQKVAEVVAEEKAKVELPGVVTLIQNGAFRIFGHLTGTVASSTTTTVDEAIPAPPLPAPTILESDRKETIVIAQKTIAGDIVTADIQSGHEIHKPISRVDVIKESGQLAPQTELHLPNLHIPDVPLNRAIEEQPILPTVDTTAKPTAVDTTEQKAPEPKLPPEQQFPTFVYIHEQTPISQSSSQVSNPLEYKDESEQLLPNLTKKAVEDGAAFIEIAEQMKPDNMKKTTKDVSQESEQVPKEQLPNLTAKVVHDGAAFIDQLEQQKSNTQLLPNLPTKSVQDGALFLDVVENSGQSL